MQVGDTPAAEFGEAARAFAANFGTWSVNEADKTPIRRFEGALVPNNEGIETNSISLAGDELKLVRTVTRDVIGPVPHTVPRSLRHGPGNRQ
jgi:hypothetical protein